MHGDISDNELAQVLRRTVDDLRKNIDPALQATYADIAVVRLRALGLYANMRVGLPVDGDQRYALEWYAGRLLEAIEQRAWSTVDSLLTQADNLVPKDVH